MARHGWIASPLVVVAMSGGSYWRKSTDVRELAKVNDRVPQPIALVTDFPFSRRTESVHAQRATLNMTHNSDFFNRSTPYNQWEKANCLWCDNQWKTAHGDGVSWQDNQWCKSDGSWPDESWKPQQWNEPQQWDNRRNDDETMQANQWNEDQAWQASQWKAEGGGRTTLP